MRDMLGYIKSCPGQAECTEQIGRGRQWYRKYELLEKLKAGVEPPSDSASVSRHQEDAVVELKSELLLSNKSEAS